MSKPLAYIGIDPGVKGSIVCLYQEESALAIHTKTLANATPTAIWDFLNSWDLWDTFAVIEQQAPRPTRWFDRVKRSWASSILRSTVVLYGSYMQLRGMLTASRIPYEDCPPKRWQKSLCVRREKGTKDADWKRLLKTRAQQLYPSFSSGVTLVTADALLMAHYGREKRLIHSLSGKRRHREEQE